MRNGLLLCALLCTPLLGCGDKTAPNAKAPVKVEAKAPVKVEAKAPAKVETKTLSDFDKYRRKSMAVEAKINLRQMVDSATVYFETEHVTKTGEPAPKALPSSAPLTPAATACKDGKPVKHKPAEEMWSHTGWQALNFQVDRDFRYQYEWISDGKSFTARAVGDLDCNGVFSIVEETGKVTTEGMVERDKNSPRVTRPLE